MIGFSRCLETQPLTSYNNSMMSMNTADLNAPDNHQKSHCCKNGIFSVLNWLLIKKLQISIQSLHRCLRFFKSHRHSRFALIINTNVLHIAEIEMYRKVFMLDICVARIIIMCNWCERPFCVSFPRYIHTHILYFIFL